MVVKRHHEKRSLLRTSGAEVDSHQALAQPTWQSYSLGEIQVHHQVESHINRKVIPYEKPLSLYSEQYSTVLLKVLIDLVPSVK